MASNAVAAPPTTSTASNALPEINVISPGTSYSSASNVDVDPSASASSSSAPFHDKPHPNPMAGPLPTKAGEIGFMPPEREENAEEGRSSMDGMNAAEADARNGRHPADRSQANLAGSSSSSRNASRTTVNMPMPPKSVTSRIWTKKFGGVTVRAIVRFTVVLAIVIGTIVGWVFSAISVGHSSHNNNNNNSNNSNGGGGNNSSISPIFLHLLFAVVVIIELVLLERTLFRVRAERYAHKHPGEMLPLHRNAATAQIAARGMPLAPWNRPSLPSYAAALGFRGTGDVEDGLIAAPPPPAYGNTRGSTLLLTTLVQNRSRNSLSELRESNEEEYDSPSRRASMHSDDSMPSADRHHQPQTVVARTSNEQNRPLSYDTSEYQVNLQQAQRLEVVLTGSQENVGSERR